MTVKQLIRKLKHPPCDRIVRIEFADGGIYEVSPDTRHAQQSLQNKKRGQKRPLTKQ
ncbi:MAG: hypothetical protein WBF09_20625 [Candidatus Acidiferrum sp.]